MSKIDSETKKKYANEHPLGRKSTKDNTIKLAKSQQMKIREKKLQSLFEEEVEKRELLYGDMVDEFEQNKIYKRLEKKILGRNK